MGYGMPLQPTPEPNPREVVEWRLDVEYAKAVGLKAPRFGALRHATLNWVIERLIDDEIIQMNHVEALRRISGALGHPLAGQGKTCLDLADLAVAAIEAGKAGA